MTAVLRVETVQTLRDFTELIEKVGNEGDVTLWYRGCGSSSFTLVPRLYRHSTTKDFAGLIKYESSIISRFKERSLPYLTRTLSDNWDCLFLMQHYGVPTRLLDWTESPFISLYFAITHQPLAVTVGNEPLSRDAAVWVLNPVAWNRHVLQYLSYKEGILSLNDSPLTGYASDQRGPH